MVLAGLQNQLEQTTKQQEATKAQLDQLYEKLRQSETTKDAKIDELTNLCSDLLIKLDNANGTNGKTPVISPNKKLVGDKKPEVGAGDRAKD